MNSIILQIVRIRTITGCTLCHLFENYATAIGCLYSVLQGRDSITARCCFEAADVAAKLAHDLRYDEADQTTN